MHSAAFQIWITRTQPSMYVHTVHTLYICAIGGPPAGQADAILRSPAQQCDLVAGRMATSWCYGSAPAHSTSFGLHSVEGRRSVSITDSLESTSSQSQQISRVFAGNFVTMAPKLLVSGGTSEYVVRRTVSQFLLALAKLSTRGSIVARWRAFVEIQRKLDIHALAVKGRRFMPSSTDAGSPALCNYAAFPRGSRIHG